MDSKTPSASPAILADQALGSTSGRRLVMESLRMLAQQQPAGPELIEQTGAHIYLKGGVAALQQAATLAGSWEDALAEITRHHLLSGFWRT
jgi:hypothetical protein